MDMITLDPKERPTINKCIDKWDSALPRAYSRIFFQLSSSFVLPQYLYSDMKISLLRKFMPQIWLACFNSKQLTMYEPIEKVIFERLRDDSISDYNNEYKYCEDEN